MTRKLLLALFAPVVAGLPYTTPIVQMAARSVLLAAPVLPGPWNGWVGFAEFQ